MSDPRRQPPTQLTLEQQLVAARMEIQVLHEHVGGLMADKIKLQSMLRVIGSQQATPRDNPNKTSGSPIAKVPPKSVIIPPKGKPVSARVANKK